MQTLKLIFILFSLIAVGAAAADIAMSAEVMQAEAPLKSLPENWQQFSYQQWIQKLDISECSAKYDGHEERFRSIVNLSDKTILLLISCDLGAYQDAYYVYRLEQTSQRILQLSFNLPLDDKFKLGVTKLIWGTIYLSDSGSSLELLHLSSASGMCGYRAIFSLPHLLSTEAINPSMIFADEDCYNGISVEQWPEIELQY